MSSVSFFGDSAVLVHPLAADPARLATALSALDGVEEVVPGAVICVRFAPGKARDLEPAVAALVAEFEENRLERAHGSPGSPLGADRNATTVELTVSFDGPDLEEVAERCGLSREQLIEAILTADLTVAYLGFAPGFAYITGLPSPLSELERRPTPRTSVPAGSVGIAGGYLGIYPRSSPGGWNLVGQTDAELFDPVTPPYSALQAGDTVKILHAGDLEPTHVRGLPRKQPQTGVRPRSDSHRRIEVVEPGVLTTLQDGGRTGVAHLGVPKGGAADHHSMVLANLTAGNAEDSGVLETTISGPTVRFNDAAHAVVIGATWDLNGRAMEPGVVEEIPAGGLVAIGASSELHAYLAVAGGFEGPELFGSCSSDQLSGLGTGPLEIGDTFGMGEPGQPRGYATPLTRGATVVRLVRGPQLVEDELLAELTRTTFSVSPDSNRIGVRLLGGRPPANDDRERRLVVGSARHGSYGMVPGALQIPPSGEPVVLLCDHATMGGYPVVATVITADIGVVAQRRPGEALQFEIVDLDEAIQALEALDRQVSHAPTGLYPIGPVS